MDLTVRQCSSLLLLLGLPAVSNDCTLSIDPQGFVIKGWLRPLDLCFWYTALLIRINSIPTSAVSRQTMFHITTKFKSKSWRPTIRVSDWNACVRLVATCWWNDLRWQRLLHLRFCCTARFIWKNRIPTIDISLRTMFHITTKFISKSWRPTLRVSQAPNVSEQSKKHWQGCKYVHCSPYVGIANVRIYDPTLFTCPDSIESLLLPQEKNLQTLVWESSAQWELLVQGLAACYFRGNMIFPADLEKPNSLLTRLNALVDSMWLTTCTWTHDLRN